MRVSTCLLVVGIGIATPLAAEPPTATSSPRASIAELNGAELFDHEWTYVEPDRSVGFARNAFLRTWLMLNAASSSERLLASARASRGDGLGPLHNATSCAACHLNGGAAGVRHNVTLLTVEPRSLAVTRGNLRHALQLMRVFPGLLNENGVLSIETVVHDRSTRDGYDDIRNRLTRYVPGGIDDAWFVPEKRTSRAVAARPVVAGRNGDVDFYLSQRNPPPLFGLGLIDRITKFRLLQIAEDQARKSDGRVTGRVAEKFGWRGQIPSLSAFVSQACAGELGLTHVSALQPGDPANVAYTPPGLDLTAEDVEKLTGFVASLPQPVEAPQPQDTHDDVFAGESVFNSIGCVVCHVPDVYPVQDIFSDLLLHDMGEKLQAPSPAPLGHLKANLLTPKRYSMHGPITGAAPAYYSGSSPQQGIPAPEVIARPEQPQFPRGARPEPAEPTGAARQQTVATWDELQREWRTPPLWGIADTAPYLHDGRAETLEEAILWHGGEAQESRERFARLKPSEKQQLLAFLSSLRAPPAPNRVK